MKLRYRCIAALSIVLFSSTLFFSTSATSAPKSSSKKAAKKRARARRNVLAQQQAGALQNATNGELAEALVGEPNAHAFDPTPSSDPFLPSFPAATEIQAVAPAAGAGAGGARTQNNSVSPSPRQKKFSSVFTPPKRSVLLDLDAKALVPGLEVQKSNSYEELGDSIKVGKYYALNAKTNGPTAYLPLPDLKMADASDTKTDPRDEQLRRWNMSYHQFMDASLHDPKFGYYGSGNVTFGAYGHFSTTPVSMSPTFGGILAYHAYAMWRSMYLAGDINDKEEFAVLEFGAGQGQLAHDFLHNVELNAEQEEKLKLKTYWSEFHKVLKYYIGERSPDLRKRQAQTIGALKSNFEIVPADARDPAIFKAKKLKGLILSNELVDAFSVHKMRLNKSGESEVAILVFAVSQELVMKGFGAQLALPIVLGQDSRIKTLVDHKIKVPDRTLILSAQEWLRIKQTLGTQNNVQDTLDERTSVHEVYLKSNSFPETKNYLKRHGEHLKALAQGMTTPSASWYMNFSAEGYIKALPQILDRGYVMTIDYGYTSELHDSQIVARLGMRTFPQKDKDQPYHEYDYPGALDMTTDVNFTDLHLVGEENGLKTVFFGAQELLVGHEINLTDTLAVVPFDLDNPCFAMKLPKTDPDFFHLKNYRVLVQKTSNINARYSIGVQSEDIFPQ